MKVVPLLNAFGASVEGEAVVIRGGFSPRYHLNRETGRFSLPGHELDGEKIKGKILFCDYARGGVAAGWALNALKEMDIAPIAIIFIRSNPVMVQGSIFANITIADGISWEAFDSIQTMDLVEIDPEKNQLIIKDKKISTVLL
ncbi:DUF126 domain-containing protein [Mammaliicoccus sciuri]|uniref:Predicted aconitase subunit 2 n=1 Tax=Sporosarcina newyorkensis TaxID=759851 RepID=A0A1T4XYV9_9BACL|nr:DUF126 domain-containing protein [Sporosarcina newyorkensis]SKA94747.1 predicted aconitase subunit 2 [Sporosarcina newyorkensis]